MSALSRTASGGPSSTVGKLGVACAFFLASAPASADPEHLAEVKNFASTVAVAQTVRESCPGVEPDEHLLEALRQRLHVVEADQDVFARVEHLSAETLKRGLALAPSREAWCAGVFELYGPEGTVISGMLRR